MNEAEDGTARVGEVTGLLLAYREGERGVLDRLLPLLYDELRRLARRQLARGRRDGVIDTTGLVHELYLRLVDQTRVEARDRAHFLAIAARAMRQVLIGFARRRRSAKRGGADLVATTLDEGHALVVEEVEWLLALDTALTRLGAQSPRLAQVVECRFFAGLSEEDTAQALGVSLRTTQREWMRARAWLQAELGVTPRAASART